MKYHDISKKLYIISNQEHILAEGPLWDSKYKRFLFVDIDKKSFYIFKNKSLSKFLLPIKITSIILTKNSRYLILSTFNSLIKYDIYKKKIIYTLNKSKFKNERFNDSYVYNRSAFLISSMDQKQKKNVGNLYFFYKFKKKFLLKNFIIGNGIDFCRLKKIFYFSISDLGLVKSFKISNRTIYEDKIFCKIPKKFGVPDGITVDKNGGVWVACWGGGCLLRYDQFGKITDIFKVPDLYTTSICFGGSSMNKIYITTAKNKNSNILGSVYSFNTNYTGYASRYLSS